MSKLRDFVGKVPELCGAKDMDQVGRINKLIFDHEISNPESEFSKGRFNTTSERLSYLFNFKGDEEKKKYCEALLMLKTMKGYEDKDGEDHTPEITQLEKYIKSREPLHPEINSHMSLSEARKSAWV